MGAELAKARTDKEIQAFFVTTVVDLTRKIPIEVMEKFLMSLTAKERDEAMLGKLREMFPVEFENEL